MNRVCMRCGRSLEGGDYGGWCGLCDDCPRCHRVVDEIQIHRDGDDSYCLLCEKDYLAEKQAQLEAVYDIFQNDEDDVDDIHEKSKGSLAGESQILELSGETKVKVLKPEKRTFRDFNERSTPPVALLIIVIILAIIISLIFH